VASVIVAAKLVADLAVVVDLRVDQQQLALLDEVGDRWFLLADVLDGLLGFAGPVQGAGELTQVLGGLAVGGRFDRGDSELDGAVTFDADGVLFVSPLPDWPCRAWMPWRRMMLSTIFGVRPSSFATCVLDRPDS
jgi:hypothetical protein